MSLFARIDGIASASRRAFCGTALHLLIGATLKAASAQTVTPVRPRDPQDDASPWGVASGAEWLSAYPLFNPMLKQAGIRWLRAFYEWQTIQPKAGYWNFALPDRLVENARANGIRLTGVFAYLASWASADGGTRKFPIRDIQFWRDYVTGMVARYHIDIDHWEVWNEFNGSFAENGSATLYAQLVREASIAAKKVDSNAKIGVSVANFDVGFLDAAIKAGAADHFDYVCVHPYEKLAMLSDGGEIAFLGMVVTLRKMLASNRQPENLPLWITEIGSLAPAIPNTEADEAQARLLAKAYLLAIASGFQRVFWFEARGPSYDGRSDFGLIRPDMSLRPSYKVLQSLTAQLGPQPIPAGWLDIDNGGYGFVFRAADGYVMAVWAPATRAIRTEFAADVRIFDLLGNETLLPAKTALTIQNAPVLIAGLPATLIEQARANQDKPYPWGGEFTGNRVVTVRLQAANVENGIKQINQATTVSSDKWRRTDFSRPDQEGHYVYFSVAPEFATFGTKRLEIRATVRRVEPDKPAGISINYESQHGYVNTNYTSIPEGDEWHDLSWTINDANFVGAWGWNFRINAISSPNEILVWEVSVRKF